MESCDYLRNLPKVTTELYRIKIADGSYLDSRHMIRFDIKIQGYTFNIAAQVIPTYGLVSCLLGTIDLKRLRAKLDFETNTLKFKIPSDVPFKIKENIYLRPNASRRVTIHGHLPRNAQYGEVVIRGSRLGERVTSSCF